MIFREKEIVQHNHVMAETISFSLNNEDFSSLSDRQKMPLFLGSE
jgi:hypothetical protein